MRRGLTFPGDGRILVFLDSPIATKSVLLPFLLLIALLPVVLGDPQMWIFAPAAFLLTAYYFSRILPMRRSNSILILDREAVSLAKAGEEQWRVVWNQIGQIERNSPHRTLVFRDRTGLELAQTPPFQLEPIELGQLIAAMTVRTNPGVECFRLGDVPSGTRAMRFIRGSICLIPSAIALGSMLVSFRTSGRLENFQLTELLLICIPFCMGGMDLVVASTWKDVSRERVPLEYSFNGSMLPYIHWILAGNPVEGDFSFQYKTADLTAAKSGAPALSAATAVFLTLLLAFSAIFGWIFLIFAPFIGLAWIILRITERNKRKLQDHSRDEVVLTGSSIQVWNRGEYFPVEIQGSPKVRTYEKFKSELTLVRGENKLLFDPTEMIPLK